MAARSGSRRTAWAPSPWPSLPQARPGGDVWVTPEMIPGPHSRQAWVSATARAQCTGRPVRAGRDRLSCVPARTRVGMPAFSWYAEPQPGRAGLIFVHRKSPSWTTAAARGVAALSTAVQACRALSGNAVAVAWVLFAVAASVAASAVNAFLQARQASNPQQATRGVLLVPSTTAVTNKPPTIGASWRRPQVRATAPAQGRTCDHTWAHATLLPMPDTCTHRSRCSPGEPSHEPVAEPRLTPLSTWVYVFLAITAVAGLLWTTL